MRASNDDGLDLSAIAALAVDDHRAAPCAVVAAAVRRDGKVLRGLGAAGRLWRDPDAPPARPHTLFDLASLTKSVTALTLARLARTRRLERGTELAEVVP